MPLPPLRSAGAPRRRAPRTSGVALSLLCLLAGGVGAQPEDRRRVTIAAAMADPTAVPDERGEWIQLRNTSRSPVELKGWRLDSGRDAGWTIAQPLLLQPGASVTVAREPRPALNGGVRAALGYTGIALGNEGDWVAVRDARGATVDSLAWGRAPRGVPVQGGGSRATPAPPPRPAPRVAAPVPDDAPRGAPAELVVRILDVGQGDAILIQNGGSTVLVDGGPDPRALGAHLDRLGLNGATIDAVILSHAHADHYQGLRELFAPRRRITVRYLWENGDPSPNSTLARLRDAIGAGVRHGLVYRDSDDPCATGTPHCTITLRGGARLHIMRPDPQAQDPNNRSTALKLVGPDSASFTMWMAGDAEQEAIDYFERTGFAERPGMRADVLKANHHGSCNGVSDRYLELVRPSLVVASLAGVNDYGHMHAQAKAALARRGIPWHRTDANGTITLRSSGRAGERFTVLVERPGTSVGGPSDRRSSQAACR